MSNALTPLQKLDKEGPAGILDTQSDIPYLNRIPTGATLKDGVLVRIRGMVQDTLDGVIKHKKCGEYDLRYRQGLEEIPNLDSLSFSDTYYDVDRYTIVSVPGLLVSNSDETALSELFTEKAVIETKSPVEMSPRVILSDDPPALVPVEPEPLVRTCSVSPHPIPDSISTMTPQAGRVSLVAHVTRDASEEMTHFKLHQLVDMVGIISNCTQDLSLPLVDFTMEVISIAAVSSLETDELDSQMMKNARILLRDFFSKEIFMGDVLSSEYLLLQLISNRYDSPAVPTLGSWALNISNSQTVDLKKLEFFLREISADPLVVLPCSNATLLQEKFYPERLDTNDFTSPGMLQLSNNTLLILDERNLREGNVNALNVLVITKAVRDQELMGVFGNQMVNFPIDIKSVILTEQGPSMFTASNPAQGISGTVPMAHLPFRAADVSVMTQCLSPEEKTLIAKYIKQCQKLIPKVTIPETVVEEFENDWVASRKTFDNIPTDDIHIWATLLRSMPASFGSDQVSSDHWKAVMALELERRMRISAIDDQSVDTKTRIAVTGA